MTSALQHCKTAKLQNCKKFTIEKEAEFKTSVLIKKSMYLIKTLMK